MTPEAIKAAQLNNVPDEFIGLHNYWVTGAIVPKVVVTKHVDTSKSVVTETKSVTGAIKKTYSNKPTYYTAEIKQVDTSDPTKRSNTYMFNYLGMTNLSRTSAVIENGELTLEHRPTSAPYSKEIRKPASGKTFKEPVDYKGNVIEGVDTYNQGATPYQMTPFNKYVQIDLVERVTYGSGSWSTSNPVWSGGVNARETTKLSYIELNELLGLLGITESQYTDSSKSIALTEKKDPSTHIVSTGAEIVQDGNKYTGKVYYNGVDTKVESPSGKITSYQKTYPSHVCFWIYEADGETGVRGGHEIAKFAASADNTITVVKGTKKSWNATTKTFTYPKEGRLRLMVEEGSILTAQGKGWGDEDYITLK